MKTFIVLYRIESEMDPLDAPFLISCMADSAYHAEIQCLSAIPDSDVVWVVKTANYRKALTDYYNNQGE